MKQYLIDVRSILDDPGGSIMVDDAYALEELVVGDERFVLRRPASFSITVSNAGTGLVVHGTVTAEVTASCARCLCEFDDEITGDVEASFTLPGREPLEDETGEVGVEGKIDVAPALYAGLVIEAPFAPVHSEECAGLCASCGTDLNVAECTCAQQPQDDHPFAALQGLVTKPEGEDDPA